MRDRDELPTQHIVHGQKKSVARIGCHLLHFEVFSFAVVYTLFSQSPHFHLHSSLINHITKTTNFLGKIRPPSHNSVRYKMSDACLDPSFASYVTRPIERKRPVSMHATDIIKLFQKIARKTRKPIMRQTETKKMQLACNFSVKRIPCIVITQNQRRQPQPAPLAVVRLQQRRSAQKRA